MAYLMSKFYDWFMHSAEEASLHDWRRELLADAIGDVLEVGAGTGVNLPLYPDEPGAIDRLVLMEPDPHMRSQLFKKSKPLFANQPVEVVSEPLGDLPSWMGPFDTVVSTLVLCSVPDQSEALGQIYDLLRPGGRFVFLEHVESHVPKERRWQHRLEPVWKRFTGDCHLTRDTAHAIEDAGFEMEYVTREPMRKAFFFLRATVRGIARRPE